jgi:hypothetical protein
MRGQRIHFVLTFINYFLEIAIPKAFKAHENKATNLSNPQFIVSSSLDIIISGQHKNI